MKDEMPKMPKRINIEEADNGFIVRHFDGKEEKQSVHESMESAMGVMQEMMSGKKNDKKMDDLADKFGPK